MDIRIRLVPIDDPANKYDGLIYYDDKKIAYEAVIEWRVKRISKDFQWKMVPVVIDEAYDMPSHREKWPNSRNTKRVK